MTRIRFSASSFRRRNNGNPIVLTIIRFSERLARGMSRGELCQMGLEMMVGPHFSAGRVVLICASAMIRVLNGLASTMRSGDSSISKSQKASANSSRFKDHAASRPPPHQRAEILRMSVIDTSLS
jgi:hypothetical protein